jgi:hypothetical protein
MYDVYPTKEDREVNFSPEVRKHYKAYFRKYPNPNTWSMHPFDTFVKELPNKESLFTIFRKLMEEYMILHNFTMYSEEKDKTYDIKHAEQKGVIVVPKNTGQLTVAHYMTILQKLTSLAMELLYRLVAPPLPDNYDFSKDPLKVKSKANQERLKNNLGKRPDSNTVQKLINIIPSAKSIENAMRNTGLYASITFIAQYNYFVDNGGGPVIELYNGQVVNDAKVFRDIDEINMKSKTGKLELMVMSIDNNGRFTIIDYLKKSKAERAAERAGRKATFTKVDKFVNPKARDVPFYSGGRGKSVWYNTADAQPLVHATPLKAGILPTTLGDIHSTPFGRGGGRGGRGGRGGGRGGGISGSGTSDEPFILETPERPSESSSGMHLTPDAAADLDETQDYEPTD